MKPTHFRSHASIALVTAGSLLFGSVAQATDIAEIPMAVKSTVYPNIMFTLDDSGSMQFEIMPDNYIFQSARYMFPRATSVYGGDDYGNRSVDFDATNPYTCALRSSHFNAMYYNPAVTYKPWSKSDNTEMANADPTAAYHNPFNTGAGSRNLTVNNTQSARWLESAGTVTDETSSKTFYPATYFRYTGTNAANNLDLNCAKYQRVEIKSGNAPFTKAGTRTDCAGASCTYTEEMQNFANWYTYYRSRILTARAGVGKAFAKAGTKVRVGFAAINKDSSSVDGVNTSTVIRGVRPFTGTARTDFFNELYGHTIPAAGTPLRKALDDVGQYFSRTDSLGPWAETPGVGGTQLTCRQNYQVLMTDGYWNGDGASTVAAQANNDGTGGPTQTSAGGETYTYSAVNPYTDSWSDTLADAAMYYWKNDLRSDLANNVPPNDKDPAFWQHMVNFTIGLGVQGTVPLTDIAAAFTDTPTTINWPDPSTSDARKLDDLAHAAVNSRGGFFSTLNPTAFEQALADALNDISSRDAAAAAVAVTSHNLQPGDSTAYVSEYYPADWSGQLSAYVLDPATGLPGANPVWTAADQLKARTAASRYIATHTGNSGAGQGIQFQPTTAGTVTKLSAAQQTLLNTPATLDGADVVAYLRGDRSKEAATYRVRTQLLGDIINAEPLFVREPRANYTDNGYAQFKTDFSGRTTVVYQGANDGMLHAFMAKDPDGGKELWAYIPNLLMPTLNALSSRNGFTHRFYVDGTPAAGDVDFQNTAGAVGGGTDWTTMLVGGLGKGGPGYYALDIKNPSAASEADVAAKVMWEFPNGGTNATTRANVGYSFGKPVIVKTQNEGWVVLVTSGYNNGNDTGGDGEGYLYVLNARTGAVIKELCATTTANCADGPGSAADPSGLAYISAYVENADVDNTVDFVYGGDLKGNVWRFDLTGPKAGWGVKKLATLVDGAGNYQPITSTPELAKVQQNGAFKRLVYVGTGQYLGDSDIPGAVGANSHATQTQSMYVLLDDLSAAPTISPLRTNLVQQSVTPGGVFTTSQVDYNVKKGWFIDLPNAGDRIVADPGIALTTLAFNVNTPSPDPCKAGGTSYSVFMDYAYEQGTRTYVGAVMSPVRDALSSRIVMVKTTTGEVRGITRTTKRGIDVQTIPTLGSGGGTKRVSWRELIEQ
jgi:type IV pilus assembly protein PilY1